MTYIVSANINSRITVVVAHIIILFIYYLLIFILLCFKMLCKLACCLHESILFIYYYFVQCSRSYSLYFYFIVIILRVLLHSLNTIVLTSAYLNLDTEMNEYAI